MEDSLQLPDDNDYIQAQDLLSPEPLINSRENTPPHSLAYSNSTCVKDRMGDLQFRSPIAFESSSHMGQYSPTKTGIIKSNNENYQINNQKTVTSSPQQNYQKDQISNKQKYKKIHPKSKIVSNKSPPKVEKVSSQLQKREEMEKDKKGPSQGERKTIAKGDSLDLKRRVRQLEQALHIETVISEQLRTKLSVTTTLLEAKLKQSGLQYFFNLKNTSRDLRNIDIFVEMNALQKTITQKEIIIDRQRNQIKEVQIQVQRAKLKKKSQKSPTRQLRELNEQIQKLIEQRQSLMSYIDEQKATLQRKIEYIAELEQQVNRMGDKESYYTNSERPKIIKQLGDYKFENKRISEELQTAKMELNLIQMNYKGEIENFNSKKEQMERMLIAQEQQLRSLKQLQQEREIKYYTSTSTQKEDSQKELLLRELVLLKNQRDHYLNQYRKRTQDSAKLYALQLKLKALSHHKLAL